MVIIQTNDFDHAAQYQALRAAGPTTGAVATFTGLVRDFGDQSQVSGLFLEHYPGMTERVIEDLIRQASQRWDVQAVRVIHRVGELALGDQIVFVGVSSAHRGDAFAACQFIMDALKTTAPFWKKELAADGDHWVEQKDSDLEQAQQWQDDTP
ncbi:molybdopterin synthase catalytic subunit MoaE [Marinobacter sp. SS21]|uniref:molybdopterin synthase catalytic subunit MoaE n=1 Tax=Marinobacter sp. SS21 TaxID=2979460 RepID=UPI00232E2291|nr:molybdopterin synthase catalytic subunit MoaE [Marinobacter sp. SS21]MDC0661315.1 molybdopterin synthase catalytic subunit MoaE [Marinobacter sp. SS21]